MHSKFGPRRAGRIMQPEPTHPSQNGRFHIRRAEHVREYDQHFECLQIRAAVPYEYKTRQNLALVVLLTCSKSACHPRCLAEYFRTKDQVHGHATSPAQQTMINTKSSHLSSLLAETWTFVRMRLRRDICGNRLGVQTRGDIGHADNIIQEFNS